VNPIDQLHPAVQFHIVNSLGWPRLRPLQEQSLGPILAGHHALLIAPTAGGKTEAAILPVLSRMVSEDWRGLSVLYICPIKALLNNLESRLSRLTGLLGRSTQLWHGDISASEKRRTEREAPDVLLTTPESLEGILLGLRRDHRRLLGSVRCVIIDELHAFAGDDRGWHVLALLERIRALAGNEPQRIGLSATVGQPQALLDWLAGHCEGPRTLVRIEAPPAQADVKVDFVGSLENAAIVISRLHPGEKRLVFCDSRSRVEDLSQALRACGVNVFVSHAALAADLRRQAEQAFAEGQNCVIVATSTLELGLDVGDLDRVIQIDAPGSVASFLQRMGRTGRREGALRNTLFLATHDQGMLGALAIVGLFAKGYVEPVQAPPWPLHILVQQLFGMLFERELEVDEAEFREILGRVPEFSARLSDAWPEVVESLCEKGLLHRDGGRLTLGVNGEARFRGKRLADLCVSFDSPRSFPVLLGNKHLGDIDPLSLRTAGSGDGRRVLALNGRSWRVTSIDWSRERVYVEPAEEKGRSRWVGESRGASRTLAREVHRVLEHEDALPERLLTKRAQERLEQLREDMAHTLESRPFKRPDGDYEWWNYAGLAANVLLAARIEAVGGKCRAIDSYGVRVSISADSLESAGGWKGIEKKSLEGLSLGISSLKFADLIPETILARIMFLRVSMESVI
jgi:ATP-dependent helicase Lhr and Lhr-like helicase